MATSPIYNWPEPDNTDLVKNGALAMRTLGDAIDTTMATMTPKSIVDAKGDLIAASAADTPARLAVGSNFAFLQADSAQSTGLLWNNAAWTTYTPTVTAQSGTFTTVSAAGRYIRIGKLCIVNISITVTNNGTAAVQTFVTAPFTASSAQIYSGCGRENAVQGWMLQSRITADNTIRIGKYDGSYGSGTGYQLDTTTIYEVA